MSDFTPGPWGMRDTHDNCTEITSPLFEDPYSCIANVNARWMWKGEGTDPLQVANARLIAAAPDLKAALLRVSTRDGSGEHCWCQVWQPAGAEHMAYCLAARAALAAAQAPEGTS